MKPPADGWNYQAMTATPLHSVVTVSTLSFALVSTSCVHAPTCDEVDFDGCGAEYTPADDETTEGETTEGETTEGESTDGESTEGETTDGETGDEECVPDPDYPYDAGYLWGPCLEDGSCVEGKCHEHIGINILFIPISLGWMCIPTDTCSFHPTCGLTMEVPEGHFSSPCMQVCETDDDCVEGSECRVNECLWPTS
jgi:hypothetical protein